MTRYRFSAFTISTARRQLLKDACPVPLIPRYFDLLVMLVERRREAVPRREIFDRVWSDVVVSDGALSQAIRTLRRALDDEAKEPRFLRTVSRHGYQFVGGDVIEEAEDEAPLPPAAPAPLRPASVAARAMDAALGGALAGLVAGVLGGIVLTLAPGPRSSPRVVVSIAALGAIVGAIGALGVGAGLALAEARSARRRPSTLALAGALGGGLVGWLASMIGRAAIEAIFGGRLTAVGGAAEGMALGAAAGLGYWLGAPDPPQDWASRRRVALVTSLCCAVAGVLLTFAGGHLGSPSLDAVARVFPGSEVRLEPLARIFGEPGFGPITAAATSLYEGAFFGAGLALGLTRRPR